jgi:alpha-ketoglutarate-dependent taurine dioxygenase
MAFDAMNGPESKRSWAQMRKTIKPRAISLTQELVSMDFLSPDETLPLVVRSNVERVDIGRWVSENIDLVESSLLKYGGILFRGFVPGEEAELGRFLKSIPVQLMHYIEGATPRTELGEKVYTSTSFPHEQTISLHNELCYVTTWPMKIWFFCVKPADEGGETPIGDVRKVYQNIDPKVRRRFEEKGWMLLRNFGDGFGLPWQTSFRAKDKSSLESYLKSASIEFEWRDEQRLRTRQVRPAIARHPKTGEAVWFNHIGFWHVSSLEPALRDMFMSEFKEEDLPYNTYYGDGSKIEDSVIEELRRAYDKQTVAFPWEPGDILMLDNMLTAHGRNPYSGSRNILVAMGEPFSRAEA